MMKKVETILPYMTKKYHFLEKQQYPLTYRSQYKNDLISSSLISQSNRYTENKSYIKTLNGSNNSKKLKINKNLLYIFKDPKEKYKKKFVWPKITHPKLPFSERKKQTLEERKKKIMEQKPSNLFHDFYTIKWLRQKFSDSLIEKSVFSMLPDNGKPVVPDDESEEDKKHRLLMEYLDSLYKKVPDREKYVNINPKYFFDRRTFEKILKFKEIFLEFDEDQSRKMEIDEMVEMFNQNHINANLRDLVNLFFKGQNIKEEDIMKLYLDFYQFMNFALTKDQDFREFMREIKSKNKKNEEKLISNKNEEESNGYLPMNFNLMFDYFLIKGKERASIEAIENSINEMDKIINNNKDEEEKDNDNNIGGGKIINKNFKRANSIESNKNQVEEEDHENSKYYDEQLKNLNFCDLIDNFTNLFNFNDLTNNNINIGENKKGDNSNDEENTSMNRKIIENNNNNYDLNKDFKKNNLINEEDDTMKDFLQKKMNKNMIKKLNIKNYKKYHNVKLALNATKDKIKEFIDSNGKNINNLYKIQIDDENNDKQIKIINKTLFLDKNNIKNSSKDRINKFLKTKTQLLFNRNINHKSITKERKKRMISLENENKIKYINGIKYFNKNKDNNIIPYNIKKYCKTDHNYKLDYVPPELLKPKNML